VPEGNAGFLLTKYSCSKHPDQINQNLIINEFTMANLWDERYASEEYIYGTEPNAFLKTCLSGLKPGKILFPAEGEGRNAVYAASLGWEVHAFDQSIEGQKKALKLAASRHVGIEYNLLSLSDWNPEPETYDCVALIFVHLPDGLRQQVHAAAIRALKRGGMLILQGFTTDQLPRSSGGPKSLDLLFTPEKVDEDFSTLRFLEFSVTQTTLDEGPLHRGIADVVQLFAARQQG
jgi:hypothetical protein